MATATDMTAEQRGTPKSGHAPQLDGLRAIAVTMVLVAHFLFTGNNVGRLGVRLFFVLSGFLITRMLLDGQESGARLRNFYIRRALRLWPAYYLLLGLLLLAGAEGLREVAPWHLFYASNVLFALRGDFVPWYAAPWWSLATEEQFYLIWPLVVLAPPRKGLVAACLACLPLALAWKVYGMHHGWADPAALLVLPALLDALALGALLAVLHRTGSRLLPFLPWAGLAAGLLWLAGAALGKQFSPWLESLDMIAFAAAVDLAARGWGGWPGRVLAARPVAGIGRISYAIYLYHMPCWYLLTLLAPGPIAEPGPLLFAVGGGLTVALAALSWVLVERPANRFKAHFPFP